MGNCVFKGFRLEVEEMIKVVTTDGGIMELYSPITAEFITNEFPGHAIYRSRDLFSQPLFHNEELQRMWKRSSTEAEVFPRYNSTGVWKVKLVISPEQLAEIMAQETRTEELIESVRTVAKCGNGVSSSLANSDQSSLSSSRKGSLDQKFNRDI
ncbi:hypothetical protein OIU84_016262 [Salix udensis]|uniref:Uncharacterized protein n=1 Tax=Salix udensis TaxID=889485 RepID=A0AAD6J914_9ROSI|nr:hypothetical protein OIU84_016262 [Salix udensis]